MTTYATQCINCGHVDEPAAANCTKCRSTELHGFPVEVIETDEPNFELSAEALARLARAVGLRLK